jgi:hypothetical protein
MKYPDPNTIWRHYKGGLYKFLHLSTHTENGEVLVNYQSLHFGSYHSRPLDSWNGEVVLEDKTKVKRFERHN